MSPCDANNIILGIYLFVWLFFYNAKIVLLQIQICCWLMM
jgi:hypothetical protein